MPTKVRLDVVLARVASSAKKEDAMIKEASQSALRTPRMQVRRLPSLVADDLRKQILSGELPSGHRLPKEEDLRTAFGIGRPAMREAMRILEAEGLIKITRGNQGGAIVYLPQQSHTSYAIALVLAAKNVGTHDVKGALRELEPACAALCAQREDRNVTVVPKLSAIHDLSLSMIEDSNAVTNIFRQFHETIAEYCGNESLKVIVGALEKIWSSHVRTSVKNSKQKREVQAVRQSSQEHARILDRIAAGDAAGAREAVLAHMDSVQSHQSRANANSPIDIATLKAKLAL
jgi:GntR family transcriptional repressor for pyruvate dehydrogenase complex